MYYLVKKNRESVFYAITIFSYSISIFIASADFFFDKILNNYPGSLIILNILLRSFFICISIYTLPAFFSYYLTGMLRKKDRMILLILSFTSFFAEAGILIFSKESSVLENIKTYFYNIIGIMIVVSYLYSLYIILKNKNRIDTENRKFFIKGTFWWGIICVPVIVIQYLRQIFNVPYYIYFEPALFFLWNIYFFIYFVKFYYLHLGEITFSLDEFCKKFRISKKEKEIVFLIIKGYLNKEIAGQIGIRETTIKKHIYNIFKKSNISSRIDLVNLIKK